MANSSKTSNFDIVACYNELIAKDETVTPPIAAIESLISLLSSNPLTTVSETLDLLSSQSALLLSSQTNPIPLSAGTDLFQRYLISSFQQRSSSSLASSDFTTLRNHLITNSRLFIQRAKQARNKIAHHALPFIKDDSTIFTFGNSFVINAVLNHAAKAGRYFHVILIDSLTLPKPEDSSSTSSSSSSSIQLPPTMPTSTIPLHAFTYALSSLQPSQSKFKPQLLLSASAVLENGSIISPLGTHQLAILASTFNIPFHVAVESYKFVRNFPLGHGKSELERLGVRQDILDLNVIEDYDENMGGDADPDNADGAAGGGGGGGGGDGKKQNGDSSGQKGHGGEGNEMIEITPPNLISAIITENGVMTPNAVSEELIKLWF